MADSYSYPWSPKRGRYMCSLPWEEMGAGRRKEVHLMYDQHIVMQDGHTVSALLAMGGGGVIKEGGGGVREDQ